MYEAGEMKEKENSAGGEKTSSTQATEQVFAVPDLVMLEFVAILAALIVLTAWSLEVDAPLKAIADPNWTENPAKAPWYFVGLQEVLVYFDPWIAGVCAPALIILGLAFIPYLDPNPKGVGEYNFRDRRVVVTVFLIGYVLWFVLIAIGQWFRGPSWQFYWLWEDWAVAKEADQMLVNLPNLWGVILLAAYFAAGYVIPARVFKDLYKALGLARYIIACTFVLLMFGIMFKIVLRLAFHVKYIITTPYFSI
jgi:hypothetical protein